jgi:hypothetical protein
MRRLNKTQRRILTIGILLLIAMTLYLPWKAVVNPPEYTISESIGYGFITSPPNSPLGYESFVVIDYLRLLFQWAGLAIIVWFGVWLARKK